MRTVVGKNTRSNSQETHFWIGQMRTANRMLGWVSQCGKKAKLVGPPFTSMPTCKICSS